LRLQQLTMIRRHTAASDAPCGSSTRVRYVIRQADVPRTMGFNAGRERVGTKLFKAPMPHSSLPPKGVVNSKHWLRQAFGTRSQGLRNNGPLLYWKCIRYH
jgi:hypothetical protein